MTDTRTPQAARRGRPPLSESDLGPINTAPKGTGNIGARARRIVVTPFGWAHVSPAVLARIAAKRVEVTP